VTGPASRCLIVSFAVTIIGKPLGARPIGILASWQEGFAAAAAGKLAVARALQENRKSVERTR
jgi:hypothetical protein